MSAILLCLVALILSTLAQVPPADECQLVNATEPKQCPDTIGPPC